MSVRLLFLLIAGVSFVFASIFLIIGLYMKKYIKIIMKGYDKEVEGKVLEVIKSGKDGVVGKLFATFVVYQYEINNHKYIVRPYSFRKNSAINQRYFDSENVTCIIYRGNHGGTSQTKYRTGEDIIVKYNSNNPERHEILNDKDKTFTFKVFKIVGKILMIIPLIFLIISFLQRDRFNK